LVDSMMESVYWMGMDQPAKGTILPGRVECVQKQRRGVARGGGVGASERERVPWEGVESSPHENGGADTGRSPHSVRRSSRGQPTHDCVCQARGARAVRRRGSARGRGHLRSRAWTKT
jgi:hypothetical protein